MKDDIFTKNLKSMFDTKFPVKDCTVYNKECSEEGWVVYDGKSWYWCLVKDEVAKGWLGIVKLKPYIAKTDGNEFHNWMDKDNSTYPNNKKGEKIDCGYLKVMGNAKIGYSNKFCQDCYR